MEQLNSRKKHLLPNLGLNAQIFLSFLIDIILGLFFGDMCSVLIPIIKAFTNTREITIIPLIIFSLITGIGRLKHVKVRAVAVKAGPVRLSSWDFGLLRHAASLPCDEKHLIFCQPFQQRHR
jgi:hypothetical protein